MKLEIQEAAADEIQHHVRWYAQRDLRVANRLADLFESNIVRLAQNPLGFPLMEMRRNPGSIRRARLTGFPLYILYRIKSEAVEVFAVPHTSQRPGYWKSRLQR